MQVLGNHLVSIADWFEVSFLIAWRGTRCSLVLCTCDPKRATKTPEALFAGPQKASKIAGVRNLKPSDLLTEDQLFHFCFIGLDGLWAFGKSEATPETSKPSHY